MGECGILPPRFENRFSGATSCPLPSGHGGPHRSVTKWDGEIEWQTAWDCQCEDCQKDEPADWCFDWSPVAATLSPSEGGEHDR